MKQSEILERALEFFDGGLNWTQAQWFKSPEDWSDVQEMAACSAGSILLACDWDIGRSIAYADWKDYPCTETLAKVIKEQYPTFCVDSGFHPEVGAVDVITVWNDCDNRTFEEVERVFTKAILIEQENDN